MDYRQLGRTGTSVSALCLGTWRFARGRDDEYEIDRERAHDLLDAAWDHGINFIDTANVYGDPPGTSEEWIGDWLAHHDREDFVIASKVFGRMEEGPNHQGLGRKHIRAQIEGTLDRLGTDYLDVYYIHRWDDETPIAETLSTLDRLVAEGKVRHLGASTMAAWKLTKALWTSDVEGLERFEVTQPMYHVAMEDPDVERYLEVCADQELAVCPYSPLAGGFLTGKYDRGPDGELVAPDDSRATHDDHFEEYYLTDQGWTILDVLRDVAEDLDATPGQVTLRWLMDRESAVTVPIIGARTTDQLVENVGAVDLELNESHHERITAARTGEMQEL